MEYVIFSIGRQVIDPQRETRSGKTCLQIGYV